MLCLVVRGKKSPNIMDALYIKKYLLSINNLLILPGGSGRNTDQIIIGYWLEVDRGFWWASYSQASEC